jgi:hypothetical protein
VIDEAELLEVSAVWLGANRYTRLLSIKGSDQPLEAQTAKELAAFTKAAGDLTDAEPEYVAWVNNKRSEIIARGKARRVTPTTTTTTPITTTTNNTTSSNTTSTLTWTAEPWRADLEDWNRRIDEAAGPSRRKVSPDEVDAFIREVREERVLAKLAEAEQAAWEKRMRLNMVPAPVPVRVDARMRPVTG